MVKGWITKKSTRNEMIWWGDKKSNKDFTILVVFKGEGEKWYVNKQHSTFLGDNKILNKYNTRPEAIKRARLYMDKHK